MHLEIFIFEAMESFFNAYWMFLGNPLSHLKGFFVEIIPFSVVEPLVWLGIICCWIAFWETRRFFKTSKINRKGKLLLWWLLGPFLLFLLASGQKAIPGSPAPTALRPALWNLVKRPTLEKADLEAKIKIWEDNLAALFDSSSYASLPLEKIMGDCNQLMDSTLIKMGYPSGREVKKIKNMWGITRIMGLSYGGPAFHDPLTGEIAWVSQKEYPTPKSWRIKAACHEMAHAKGFTREMDAEILTALAFLSSSQSLYHSLGYLMLLVKSGEKFELPQYLKREVVNMAEQRKKVREKQWLVRTLTFINKKIGLQNSGEKYGEVDKHKKWNPQHPFFSSVIAYGQKWKVNL